VIDAPDAERLFSFHVGAFESFINEADELPAFVKARGIEFVAVPAQLVPFAVAGWNRDSAVFV
jgi:hypothetical protein